MSHERQRNFTPPRLECFAFSPTLPLRGGWLPLTLRLALRELRGGIRGFGIFLACIALGVMAIAGVASVSRSLTEGLAKEGRRILGGDVALSLVQREASAAERAFVVRHGDSASVATMRAMAIAGDKGSALVELKAVDAAYPTVGTLEAEPARPIGELLAARDGAYGAVADPVLLARLDLKVGDRINLGNLPLVITAALVSEPDKIAAGVGFGPRLLVSQDALRATGLLQPGTLVRWTYRVVLPPGSGDAGLEAFARDAKAQFPEAGWDIRSRLNAAPQFARNIERFGQFLTLVGLTALMVGGVGVANAVRAFVDRQRPTIGTLKSLGASGSRVVAIYLTQVMLIALIGVAIGLVLGAVMPFLAVWLGGSLLPIPIEPVMAPAELLLAALYGALIALAFAIVPLGRAHDVPVAGLFRDIVEPERRWPRRRYLVGLALAVAAIVALAAIFAFDRRVAMLYMASAVGAFVLLRLVAAGIMGLARRLPRPRATAPRLALANIHRPGALTPSLVLSLGLGVTLMVALTLIDASIRRQLTQSLPARAPSFFFLDVPNQEADRFAEFLAARVPGGKFERVPMMRGRVVSLKGVPAERIKADDQVAWVLEGDRGITFAEAPPDGRDHRGRRLVAGGL